MVSRLSQEAEAFLNLAPQILAQETLQQKAVKAASRFRPRIGASALEKPKIQFQTREVISEYGYSTLQQSPNVLHEFRQVISVDGRKIATAEKARRTLTLGIKSEDDRMKKRMLEEFEKYGLIGAVVDFGQLIGLFSNRQIRNYEFTFGGGGRIGADTMLVLSYRQIAGPDILTIFRGREAIRQQLQGEVWFRQPDGLPLRITMISSRTEDKIPISDEAVVDYAPSSHGVVLPASVVHRGFYGGQLITENTFRYTPFRKFTADADVKFPEEKKP